MSTRRRKDARSGWPAVAGVAALGLLAAVSLAMPGSPRTISGLARVIDGDTIEVNGIHVRLQGLDAEELTEAHGHEAKAAMVRLTRGQTVTCRLTGERSYERRIGVCTVLDRDLAALMVGQGYALDCARHSGGRYRSAEPATVREKLLQKPYC